MPAVTLSLTCAACGTALPTSAKFCLECGHLVAAATTTGAVGKTGGRLVPTAVLEGERKLVTVLFADLKGSMELIADRDPEDARKLLDPVLEHMCEAVEKYGGTVNQLMGDGIMALFGAPISWEDHAVRACHAALNMQELIGHYGDEIRREYGVPIQIRVGLNSGEAVLNVSGHGLYASYVAVGEAVHIAARMEQMAKPGTVLATAETVRLARGYVEAHALGPVNVKGLERPVEVAEIGRVTTLRSRFDWVPVRAMTPFKGRDIELAKLLNSFDDVTTRGTSQLAFVVGEAGIGKSRLLHEFLRAAARKGALTLVESAVPYRGGGSYRPGSQILRQCFDITDADDIQVVRDKVAGRIVALSGDSTAEGVPILALLRALPGNHRFFDLRVNERRQQAFAALAWLARRLAAERPLVFAYEDLQWVSSNARDFLDRFALKLPPSVFVVVTFRSGYDAAWLVNHGHLEIQLGGLPLAATRQIMTDLLGEHESLAALKDELPKQSGGNPLFIEERVRSMVESGELVGQPGRYRIGKRRDVMTVPPTVRAVLEARIDRLDREDKHVLQAVAAVGEVATVDLLERVSELPTDKLRMSLRRLEKTGLLVDRTDTGQLGYEFRHSLTQAVAYDSLLHKRRRELHLAILGALHDSRDFDVLARHAVQGEAWDKALTYLREAGRLAAELGAIEAVSYFERALHVMQRLAPSEGSLEAAFDLHCELRNALVPLGPQQRLLNVLNAAKELAEKLGDERRLAQVYSYFSNYYGYIGRPDLALETGEQSLILGKRAGAVDLLVAGNMSAGEIYRTLGDYAKARKYLNDALALISSRDEQEHWGQVGLPSVRVRGHLAWTLAELGNFSAARNIAAEAIRVADASNHPYSKCHACLGVGGTRIRQGEFEAAIEVLARGFAASEQVPLLRPSIAADLGLAYARCGRIGEGLPHLDAAVEGATKIGRFSRLPLLLVKCGEMHLLAGELDEAAGLARRALRLARDQKERGNEVYARQLLAETCLLEQPGSEESERNYRDALSLATELSMRPLAAHAHAGLWRVYRQRSDPAPARQHLAAAETMYRDMGMRFWLDRLESATADRRDTPASPTSVV